MRMSLLLAGTGILLVGSASPLAAQVEFEEADIYIELNNTDQDLGLHALIDGDEWRKLWIKAPNGQKLLDVKVTGKLRRQGLTEIFFESAEPPFDELSPEAFFRRFPEGEYKIRGTTLDNQKLLSFDELSHLVPAGAENVTVSGEDAAENCDGELPIVAAPVTIAWDPVTMSNPDLGLPVELVEIVKYQFVVEFEFEEAGEEQLLIFSLELPPDVTEAEVPSEFLALAFDDFTEFKFEILAVEESGNRTAIESCFEVEEED